MNDIFNKLIIGKIEQFESDFLNLSRQVFLNKDGTLRHPGEFGVYREKIVAEFLKPFLPTRLDIGSGFIITDKGNISTQCDIIIFDKENTPIIENTEQRFFPVESVVGVIEVKSVLNKTKLTEALIKLSNIKKLRYDINNKRYIYNIFENKTYNSKDLYDQMATFIICEKFDFDIENNTEQIFNTIYKDIDRSLFHNMILSLDKNCCLYSYDDSTAMYAAYLDYSKDTTFRNRIMHSTESNKKEHILTFLNYFHVLISQISVLDIDMTQYLWKEHRITDKIKI